MPHAKALRHLLLSLLVALASAAVVFGLLYPAPYRQMLQVGHIYVLVLVVDVVWAFAHTHCGQLLASRAVSAGWTSRSSALIQLAALAYGLYSISLARPVIQAFETDRFAVVSAAEIDPVAAAGATCMAYSALNGPRL